ncbi:MAG: YhdP family protein [Burkholderiaceae bacterium]|nr:YhdP family protein [Burkholderiaceae bacterium]
MSDQPTPAPPSPPGDSRGSRHTLAAELGATAHRIEHAVEETLEHGIAAAEHGIAVAEQSIARRFGMGALRLVRTTLRVVLWSLVAAYFAFGTLLIVTRYAILPRIDTWRPQIEGMAGRALQGRVTIGRIEAGWRAFNPHLALNDVQITGPRGGPALALPRVDATVSWLSLLHLEPRFAALRILSPEVSIVRLAGGDIAVAGFVLQPGNADSEESRALDWLLAQGRIAVRDARVVYRDERGAEPRELGLYELNLVLQQSLGSHSFGLQALPTAAVAGKLDVRGRFSTGAFARPSDMRRWKASVFAQLDFVDLALLSRFIDLPMQTEHAHGALRAWVGFDAGQIARSTADVALQDVTARLGSDLEPLRLASLQGRLTQRQWGELWPAGRGGQELALVSMTFRTADGQTFDPLDLKLRQARATAGEPQTIEIDATHIDLESLAAVVTHVPLPRELRDTVARHGIRGTLSNLSLSWSGDSPGLADLALKSRFSGLSSAAQPRPPTEDTVHAGLPGFENLSGSIRLEKGSGSLELASSDAVLVFPGVFEEPRLALKQLVGTIHWKQGTTLEVRADGIRAANEDAEVTAGGTYRTAAAGPGEIDLTGRITRANANGAFRYIPLVAGATTRRWLERALVGGRLADGTFRVKGDLARFPFVDPAVGEFRIAGRVTSATLDVAPGPADASGNAAPPGAIWPVLSNIDADLLFERASMTITAQRGRAYGALIEQATAHIEHLGRGATLQVRGRASGQLADMVRYVNESPVKRWIGGVTDGAETQGPARLDLTLQIPLQHAENTKVIGALALQGNAITLGGIPPFTRATGTLNFNERGLSINNLSAGLLGGQARLDASTRADGTLVFSAAGTATPAGLRPAAPIAAVQRLLERSQGSARYQATVAIKNGTELRIDSDLAGLAIDGVAPLRKSAQETLPIRIERTATAAGDDLLVQVGRAVGIRIERRPDKGALRLTRGVIALYEPPNLPEQGLLMIATMPRVDVEAWSNLLSPEPAADKPGRPAAADDTRIDFIALRTQELHVYGLRSYNLTLGATRLPEGGYAVNVVSDAATGYITWLPSADPQAIGQVKARFSRLTVPSNRERDVVEALHTPPKQIPSLDVVVDQFELSDMKLGRLELDAQNVGTGTGAAWRVRRFDITNPDMKLAATGEWGPTPGSADRRTRLKFELDAIDAGGTLGRLGFPDALSKGTGRLQGEVAWSGSPLQIDYPSLTGQVTLAVDNGRFLKVDAGNAARLLALLSLQSLGRTLQADGGRQFVEGFAFNSIRADAVVEHGVLKTDNFRMNGASAAVLMSGAVDLRNETQKLSLVVLPEIDASTAALALGVANPILGLGTFLAQLVLRDPLSKAFALQYDVSGTWTDPKIERRARITPTTEATK